MNQNEYKRLLDLKTKIDNRSASNDEKQEYMTILFRNGNVDKTQYERYLSNQNSEEIIKAALTIGGLILAIWLLSKLSES